jgi:Mg-chelatase subunit ChlD
MDFLIVTLLYLVVLVVASPTSSAAPSACTNLHAISNNGDRKIAIVIDTSGSMADSDPYDLRLTAGKQIVNWLISDNEASSSQKADQLAVINFDDSPHLDFSLGDPGKASGAFDNMFPDGGTFIAGGVNMAIDQLTTQGSGDTAKRSGIFVFTDGEVFTTLAVHCLY